MNGSNYSGSLREIHIQITPKNWTSFQHYKNRTPPWIKLHRSMLTDYAFACLPVASKALAPLLWLLASEADDGEIDISMDALAFRLHMDCRVIAKGLIPLINKGFFNDASTTLAQCLRDACPEREGETEGEELFYGDAAGAAPTDDPPKQPKEGLYLDKPIPAAEIEVASTKFAMTAEEVAPIWEKFTAYYLDPDNKKNPKKWFFAWRAWLAEEAKRKADRRAQHGSAKSQKDREYDEFMEECVAAHQREWGSAA